MRKTPLVLLSVAVFGISALLIASFHFGNAEAAPETSALTRVKKDRLTVAGTRRLREAAEREKILDDFPSFSSAGLRQYLPFEAFPENSALGGESEEKETDRPDLNLERDIMMMKDPKLGYVPVERLLKAKEYKDELMVKNLGPLSGVNWREQGPNNLGGRTRALMISPNDPTGNTLFAGSVGGGLWKTTNINSPTPNWAPVNDLLGNLAVTSIAYDPSNTQIMYFTTGEGYGNVDAIRGLGVWKSTDGGATWAQLASTNTSTFSFSQKVAVTNTGAVLVATASGGLQRSANGGATWTKVLGSGLGITGAASNYAYDVDVAANGSIFATLVGSVHKSTNDGVTFGAAPTLPIAAERIEIGCAPSDGNYAYALVELANVLNGVLRTTDGGATWTLRTEPADADPGIPATDFSRRQAWYDLSIAVDPNNRDRFFAGGIDLFVTADGAGTWSQISHWYGGFGFQYAHADQHIALFQPGSSSIAYFANDGGVFRTANASAAIPTLADRNFNYRTSQFYAAAMHPTAGTSYYLAGAQDNGSHRFTTAGQQSTTAVTGGDGAFTHIDQDQPQFQWTSYVYNDYFRSVDGGNVWTGVTASTTVGQFINPTDYDDVNNRMYMAAGTNQYYRWDNPQSGSTFSIVGAAAFAGDVSAVKVSPNTANRVFFGTTSGRVVRVDNAQTGAPTFTNISVGLPAGYVACVEVETGNDNHLIVTYSNYGLNSVWESTNGGAAWTSVEGNLPDMPIRWALFNPNNSDQAVLATELGVWTTDNLNGTSTVWGASNSGLANVRVDMLQVRASDKYVVAATHGRGLYASDLFATPTALFHADSTVSYLGNSVQFTSDSYKATGWSWNFGDGSPVETTENPTHLYRSPGRYSVTLTINGGASSLVKNQYVTIVPNRGTPFTGAGGTFDTNPDDFAATTVTGTGWERGNSAVPGKNGVHSGTSAWVTGLIGNYVDGSESNLYSPNFNFSASGTYSLSLWTKYEAEQDFDGFRLQYTLDKGATWAPLGVVGPTWYNFANSSGGTSFPTGEPFFTGALTNYTQKTVDVSSLAGNPSVGFRIQFKSDTSVSAAGVAIDDFQIVGPANSPVVVFPTAAGVTISGRVCTANGSGIRNATVVVTGGSLSQPRYVTTGSFGIYAIGDLPAGETYVVTVISKRYDFPTPSLLLNVTDNVTAADFVATGR